MQSWFSARSDLPGWRTFAWMNSLPLQFLMMIFAGWVNRSQQDVIKSECLAQIIPLGERHLCQAVKELFGAPSL